MASIGDVVIYNFWGAFNKSYSNIEDWYRYKLYLVSGSIETYKNIRYRTFDLSFLVYFKLILDKEIEKRRVVTRYIARYPA